MESYFWRLFVIASSVKLLLIPAYYSTDFEVHRNWLALTHSLPLEDWYYESTSKWTLDYPPMFAYFEWLLSQVAQFVDPAMLSVKNLDYASKATIYFQRGSVIVMDIVYALGALLCLRALKISPKTLKHFAGETLLLFNVGLILVDHIHFQYNGMLFGILLLSIGFLLKDQMLLSAFTFSLLLNFKHIFLYLAPAFGIYFLKNYCLINNQRLARFIKIGAVTLLPFVISFGPFYSQLPQVFSRLFPFKRGLTHAYWAPNIWAVYNVADKVAVHVLEISETSNITSTSGLVQEIEHVALPKITPHITFVLTIFFMMPILLKLYYFTEKGDRKKVFLRAVVICAATSFMFGWHVHEKAILMSLIPLSLLSVIDATDARYAFLLGISGYYSLFPLLFDADLLLLRYTLYVAYMSFMYSQFCRMYKSAKITNILEITYVCGFFLIALYEHLISLLFGLDEKLPFMPLLLTSFYCSLGIIYVYMRYYLFTMGFKFESVIGANVWTTKPQNKTKFSKSKKKFKLKQK